MFKLSRLKKLRIAVSLILFVLVLFSFFDYDKILPKKFYDSLLSLQILPAVINIITSFGIISLGLILILLLTIFFGRVYCSSICPLGTLQDVVIYFRRKINRKSKFNFSGPYNKTRYILLSAVIVSGISGNLFLISLFDPFSNFGRFINVLLHPFITAINNALARIVQSFKVYYFINTPFTGINYYAVALVLVLLFLLIYFSYKRGRIFCNTLCPVGAFLSILSRFARYKIIVDETTCTHCRKCEKVCKAECIDSKNMKIDFSSCISCFNCFDACPTIGLKYSGKSPVIKSSKVEIEINRSRREFITKVVAAGTTATTFAFMKNKSETYSEITYDNNNIPVSPPGSRSLKQFTERCTACHLCIAACPTKVLTPGILDYGLEGLFQPKLSFDKSFCNFDCKVCSDVCPANAIEPMSLEEKKLTQIGKAKFIKADCIVETKGTDCGACSEHCPTKAVYMIPYKGLYLPELNNDICIGCGACQKACPTKPRKAIFVIASKEHLKAKKPTPKKLEKGFESSQEFPF